VIGASVPGAQAGLAATVNRALDGNEESRFLGTMSQLQLSALLSLLCVTALAVAGRRPYLDEFHGRLRRTVAALLLIGILTLAVFSSVTSFGSAEEIDPATIWLPLLLAGHVFLAGFLLAWWWLRGDVSAARFLSLSREGLWTKLRHGIAAGCGGWLLTVMVTGAAAGMGAATGTVAEPAELPPIMIWLAALPIGHKLAIVLTAMSVEEAFFRGFLQPRFGLLVSSVLFALSHFNYGLPFMVVGVFTISLVIGRTLERTGDLLPCIVAHGVFDSVQLFVVLPWAVRMWGTSATG
jgi:membrane protease YdiL (CAAX protease family)